MKKQILVIFSMLSLAITLAVGAAYASPDGTLRANIPFDFSVGNETLPAGAYTVSPTSMQGVLMVRSTDGRKGVVILTNGLQTTRWQDQTKLIFRRYDDQYFLAQVWTEGDYNGREIGKSRTERELIKSRSKFLAKNAVEPEIVCIVAE